MIHHRHLHFQQDQLRRLDLLRQWRQQDRLRPVHQFFLSHLFFLSHQLYLPRPLCQAHQLHQFD
jgi:hypothetical protein